ncbi:MAG: hypothetical protein GY757_13665, partial [bacterium]|nr:hypothetical protein [bacterium]
KEAAGKAKSIARYIVNNTAQKTSFTVLNIDAGEKLTTIAPTTQNKTAVIKAIDSGRLNRARQTARIPGMIFLDLNKKIANVSGNKYIYFFSARTNAPEMTTLAINREANFIGQSGALFFAIVPKTQKKTTGKTNYPALLAQKCGGIYVPGTTGTITKKLEAIHNSYYEIVFPIIDEFSQQAENLTLRPNRKGARFCTLKNLKIGKRLTDILSLEKELDILALIKDNTWYNLQLESLNADIHSGSKKKNAQNQYHIKIPAPY